MHFFAIIATALVGASTTMALPATKRNDCFGLEGSPECCAVNALGLADLDCAPPPTVPQNVTEFVSICAAIGQQAQCCVLPILGQALVCQAPPA